jgi:hypothetical protein
MWSQSVGGEADRPSLKRQPLCELGVPVLFTEAARFAPRRDFDLPGTPTRMMLRKGKNPYDAP